MLIHHRKLKLVADTKAYNIQGMTFTPACNISSCMNNNIVLFRSTLDPMLYIIMLIYLTQNFICCVALCICICVCATQCIWVHMHILADYVSNTLSVEKLVSCLAASFATAPKRRLFLENTRGQHRHPNLACLPSPVAEKETVLARVE